MNQFRDFFNFFKKDKFFFVQVCVIFSCYYIYIVFKEKCFRFLGKKRFMYYIECYIILLLVGMLKMLILLGGVNINFRFYVLLYMIMVLDIVQFR